MTRKLIPLMLIVLGAAGAYGALRNLRSADLPSGEKPLLYLPNGKYLKVASLGHSGLAADLVYLWAIQYYSDYERQDRFTYVEHVFGKVIPELDPNYLDPYSLGALIMIVEKKDLEAGLALLEQGIRANPDKWVLPYLAAWECYHHGEYKRAAAFMDIAIANPDAPDYLQRNQAGFVEMSGDLHASYRMWREIYEDPESDDHAKGVAERQMRDLHVRIDLENLNSALETFRGRYGRPPGSLDALVRAGLLDYLPLDPDGNPYPYDSFTGKVLRSSGQVLGGS